MSTKPPLHASDLRSPTSDQFEALGAFFRNQNFARFAVTMTPFPLPTEVAFIHEASDRGDALLEKYFGESVVTIEGKRVVAHHVIMPKGDEALEVADFIIQAAGAQARRGIQPNASIRRDFEVIFRSNPLWSSFFALESAPV